MFKVITAPDEPRRMGLFESLRTTEIFLAGSIEMGKAREWQQEVIDRYQSVENLTIFNPRRKDWDASWEQSLSNKNLVQQIDWELTMLDRADYIFLYLQAGTLSPISMMELGLHLNKSSSVVVCEPDFWREVNIHVTCTRYGVEVHSSLEAGLQALDELIGV